MKKCDSLCVECKRANWDYYDLKEFKKGGKLAKVNPMFSSCFGDMEQFPNATECEKYLAEKESVTIQFKMPKDLYEMMKRGEEQYRRDGYPLHVMILDGKVIEEEGNT